MFGALNNLQCTTEVRTELKYLPNKNSNIVFLPNKFSLFPTINWKKKTTSHSDSKYFSCSILCWELTSKRILVLRMSWCHSWVSKLVGCFLAVDSFELCTSFCIHLSVYLWGAFLLGTVNSGNKSSVTISTTLWYRLQDLLGNQMDINSYYVFYYWKVLFDLPKYKSDLCQKFLNSSL